MSGPSTTALWVSFGVPSPSRAVSECRGGGVAGWCAGQRCRRVPGLLRRLQDPPPPRRPRWRPGQAPATVAGSLAVRRCRDVNPMVKPVVDVVDGTITEFPSTTTGATPWRAGCRRIAPPGSPPGAWTSPGTTPLTVDSKSSSGVALSRTTNFQTLVPNNYVHPTSRSRAASPRTRTPATASGPSSSRISTRRSPTRRWPRRT